MFLQKKNHIKTKNNLLKMLICQKRPANFVIYAQNANGRFFFGIG